MTKQVSKTIKYQTKLSRINELSSNELEQLKEVEKKYAFRTNDYYNSLINWDNPDDPLRRLVIPSIDELDEWGTLDASGEHKYTVAQGLEHKYKDTALILFNDVCGAYCRYCFRKRLFMNGNDDTVRNLTDALSYINNHKEINNVLITGGDPLVASTKKIVPLIKSLREMDHIKVIRIGSKMLSFNPFRIINDPTLLEMIKKYSLENKKLYIMNHFSHPNELTDQAIQAINMVLDAGAVVTNQTPMIRGINDSVDVLTSLFEKLSFIGVPPYYIFACRPTAGNITYSVPIEEAYMKFEQARSKVSGLGARARFVMSHESGKIEVSSITNKTITFRYHRSAEIKNKNKFLVYKRNPKAYWFDDYNDLIEEFQIE